LADSTAEDTFILLEQELIGVGVEVRRVAAAGRHLYNKQCGVPTEFGDLLRLNSQEVDRKPLLREGIEW
jgi:hypothetical protein